MATFALRFFAKKGKSRANVPSSKNVVCRGGLTNFTKTKEKGKKNHRTLATFPPFFLFSFLSSLFLGRGLAFSDNPDACWPVRELRTNPAEPVVKAPINRAYRDDALGFSLRFLVLPFFSCPRIAAVNFSL